MIPRKLLEAVFRRFWVLLIPIVLAPAGAIALSSDPPVYVSGATVWVTRADGIEGGTIGNASNPYLTPAQAQTQVMYDLLNTRSFRSSVAVAAGLDGSDAAADFVGTTIVIYAAGTNLLNITSATGSPELSQRVVTGVIDQYEKRVESELARQSEITVEYYTKQIEVAQQELDKRKLEMNQYLAANPRAADSGRVDLNYQRLVSNVENQTRVVDSLLGQLQEAQRTAASAPQGMEAMFSVQDTATLPTAPRPASTMKAYGIPMAALIFGLLISAAYVYVLYRTDHAIRSSEDLQDLPVPLLGTIPELAGNPGNILERFTPLRWLPGNSRRGYARAVAASISGSRSSGQQVSEGAAQ